MPIEDSRHTPFKKKRSMMDFINAAVEAERRGTITYEEWCDIRRNGSPEKIAETIERMMAAGGYDNLE